MQNFKQYFNNKQEIINLKLSQFLADEPIPRPLKEAMNYSLQAGGKRLRPVLALMIDDIFRKKFDSNHCEDILNLALSLEVVHTYSLIHDDLPCMDDDELRRGKPTCHIKFNEATAVLAGDALLTIAFQLVAKINTSGNTLAKLITTLASCIGGPGMVGGQILDMEAENRVLSLSEMKEVHKLKTGALIEASITLAAIFRNATGVEYETLKNYSNLIGVAFQIVDDILDITSTSEELGKTAQSDLNNNKSTYVSILGLEKAKQEANAIIKESKAILENIELNTNYLCDLSDYILNRSK